MCSNHLLLDGFVIKSQSLKDALLIDTTWQWAPPGGANKCLLAPHVKVFVTNWLTDQLTVVPG